jgi:hypothetical protein
MNGSTGRNVSRVTYIGLEPPEPSGDAQIMIGWLREAADELAQAHRLLDMFGPREENGIPYTLAARIAIAVEVSRE